MPISRERAAAFAKQAVAEFWKTRELQGQRQQDAARKDQGFRNAVTGSAQMNGFIAALEQIAMEAGIPGKAIYTSSRTSDLPGYFRPAKEWDLVIVHDGALLAAIETKSQVGPSFGNNFNNRTEEAIGSAVDLWTAFRENAYRRSMRPWLGYLFLLEDCPPARKPVRLRETHFPALPEFKDTSYATRYEMLCNRLILERHYDVAALLMSSRDRGRDGHFVEPNPDIGFHRFVASFSAHLEANCP